MDLPNLPWSGPSGPAGEEDAAMADVVAELTHQLGKAPPSQLWFGDDAALVDDPGGTLVLSVDALVEGVHFDLELVGLDDVGWKAVSAAVSDVAAMGAQPIYLLTAYCVPRQTRGTKSATSGKSIELQLLTKGIAAASSHYRCPAVGGDLTAADQLMVSVSVIGTSGPRDGSLCLTRGGAQPGETIFVTGACGASAAGLRLLRARRAADSRAGNHIDKDAQNLIQAYQRPIAKVAEGQAARRAGASAMIDVSDGLALDLHRLAAASGVGVHLEEVPTAPGATEDEALSGGEDFELVISTADPEGLQAEFASSGLPAPLRIGWCSRDPAERVLRDGILPVSGWQHRLS